jgi:hypothetical protein
MDVWRDVSLLWLNCLTFIAVVPFGVLFFFAVKGMRRLRQLAKKYLPVAQDKAQSVADVADRTSQKLAAPVIGLHVKTTQIDGMIRAIRRRKTV